MTPSKNPAVEASDIDTQDIRETLAHAISTHTTEPPRGLAAARDRALLAMMKPALSGVSKGEIRLVLPSGEAAVFGTSTEGDTSAELHMHSFALFGTALRRGMVGFAESYINRDIDTPDLANVFNVFLDNIEAFRSAGGGWFKTRFADKIAHRMRANTRSGSRRNIAAHYDLGNDFYAPWLDRGMTYSSAIFETESETLEAAQDNKLDAIVRDLKVAPGHRVLEIGCGWGALAERLAREGCEVVAITLSAQQLAYTRERIARAGLSDRVDVRFLDYRDVEGEFDRIVSVEMIEAVGEAHWPVYFGMLADRLKPGGHAVLQAITINEASFVRYRRNPDFIQRYIFPGGMLPTIAAMDANAANCGCSFATLREFRRCYAKTLRIWRDRFEASWPRLHTLGFDDRFYRMWIYYLTYCEVGFDRGIIDVGHYEIAKPA